MAEAELGFAPSRLRKPWATYTLLGLLAVVYAAQSIGVRFPGSTPAEFRLADLVAYGALNHDLVVLCGDWWRLATGPLLHGGFVHIALNSVVLYFAGRFIERHLGSFTLLGLIALGALGGAIASEMFSDASTVSVGASGGIMALVAAALLLSYALREDPDVLSGRSLFVRILIPSLLPTSSGVDYAAHFGGAIVGAGIAGVLCLLDDPEHDPPLRRVLAGGAALAYAACALFGAWQLLQMPMLFDPHGKHLRVNAGAIANNQPEAVARQLVASYPLDPVARLSLVAALFDAGNPAEAAAEARMGIRLVRSGGLSALYEQVQVPDLKIMLTLSLAAAGDRDSYRNAEASLPRYCRELSKELQPRLRTLGLHCG